MFSDEDELWHYYCNLEPWWWEREIIEEVDWLDKCYERVYYTAVESDYKEPRGYKTQPSFDANSHSQFTMKLFLVLIIAVAAIDAREDFFIADIARTLNKVRFVD